MRDPARIDRMVEKLRTVWHMAPDLRLGQLITNLAYNADLDVYYAEDNKYEDTMDQIIEKGGWGASPFNRHPAPADSQDAGPGQP